MQHKEQLKFWPSDQAAVKVFVVMLDNVNNAKKTGQAWWKLGHLQKNREDVV